nr:uncharacterized protein LOC111414042 [Onthophagus taurus]
MGVYRKKTHTKRYLQASFHHHSQQKRSVIKALFQRAEKICDKENLRKEERFPEDVLQKNGYTMRDIQQATKSGKQKDVSVSTTQAGIICLPYVSVMTERIARCLKKNDIVLLYDTVSKIQNALPIAKHKLTPLKEAGEYRLSCSCGKYYVGQTGRNIECRIKEHGRDIRLSRTQQSAGHTIEFDKTKVLARNGHYFQRLTREATEIHRHGNNMNRGDGSKLSRTWKMLMNSTKPSPPGFDKNNLIDT